tara:strand:+ start:39 stop:374 length:336 start_codon:yes stop_codon:yes gene_type:complete
MSDKVYYDASCYVCSLEIDTIRSRGEACGIEFIDISADDFDGNIKDFEQEMIGWFDQKATKGPETFRLMYEKMGFHRSVKVSRLPIFSTIFNAGYYVFAYAIRPYLPRKKK